jgi:hypothetical protein
MMNAAMMTDRSELKNELAHFGTQVLSAGVAVLAASIPLVLCGEKESRMLPPALLAVTLGLDAVFVLVMAIKLARGRTRVLQLWLSFRLTRAMHGVLVCA